MSNMLATCLVRIDQPFIAGVFQTALNVSILSPLLSGPRSHRGGEERCLDGPLTLTHLTQTDSIKPRFDR